MAVGAILLFILGYSFLKGANLFESSRVFYAKYDNVEGLAKSAPVTINGLKVGKVLDINFANKAGSLVVTFSVDSDFEFSKNSIVEIYSSGFIGGNNLGIKPDYTTGMLAKSGDTLSGSVSKSIIDEVTATLGPLELKIENTLSGLDTLLTGVNEILDEKGRQDLKQTLSSLNEAMVSFKGVSRNMNSLMAENKDKLSRSFDNLDVTTKNFAALSDSLAKIETGKMMTELKSVITRFNGVVTSIENGDGSMGKLLKDEELYDNLTGASKQLELLLEDMKLNPKRFVHFSLFGKRPKPYEKSQDSL